MKLKAAELILDYNLYPRNNVDRVNVRSIKEALQAGHEIPPVIIDGKTKKVVDGFHRVIACMELYGEADAEIGVIEKTYKNDQAFFADVMRYNSAHGAKLDPCDKAHCVIVAMRLKISKDILAEALRTPVSTIEEIVNERTGISSSGEILPLKNTIRRQFAGKKLTKRQEQANARLSGMSQMFYVNQLIDLIEADLLDIANEGLLERLGHLFKLLGPIVKAKKTG